MHTKPHAQVIVRLHRSRDRPDRAAPAQAADELDRVFVKARRVSLRLVAKPLEQMPDVEVAYTLQDGWPYVLVTTTFANRGDKTVEVDLLDSIRADRTFEQCPEGPQDLFWVYDRHFGQAYGILAEGHQVRRTAPVVLTVGYPPVVTSPPSDLAVFHGETATFNVGIAGMPVITVQWQVSTDGGKTFTNIRGAVQPTLTLKNVKAALNGNMYRAVLTNAFDQIVSPAATRLQRPPLRRPPARSR